MINKAEITLLFARFPGIIYFNLQLITNVFHMRGSLPLLLLGFFLQFGFGQTRPEYVLDSIEIEAGVPQTTDFNPAFRVITDESTAEGLPLKVTVYSYDMSGNVQPLRQHTYQYEDGQTVNFRVFNWDEFQQDWTIAREEIYTYQNDLLTSLTRKMIRNDQLENNRLWSYQYDDNGDETEVLLEGWDADAAAWQFLSRKISTYDENENIVRQTLQHYLGDSWRNRIRRMWNYDEGSLQPSSTVEQNWSGADNQWVNQTRKSYSMGQDGLWSGATIEIWNTDSLNWQPSIRQTSAVRNQGQEMEQSLETWQGEWINDSRNISQYEAGVNRSNFQKWDEDSLVWLDRLRYFARFQQGLLSEKLGMQAWSASRNQWENRVFTRRIMYHYKENQTTNREELSINLNCWVPNPYKSGMTFACDLPVGHTDYQLQVFNSLGQLVHSQKINPGGNHIEAPLYPGIYISHIRQADKIIDIRKLIVSE